MASQSPSQTAPLTEKQRVSPETHRRNFWLCASDAALYITGLNLVGPMTLIPFLFNQLGISHAWLGLFQISILVVALGGPLGTALAGGRRHKLSFCLKCGTLQRLPFLVIPIGAMFFFDRPQLFLILLVTAWTVSHLAAGIGQPAFMVVISHSTREKWWARMLSLRQILGAAGGIVASGFVWGINRWAGPPHNYTLLGWLSVSLLFASLYTASQIREVPLEQEQPHGWRRLRSTFTDHWTILRDDRRVRWIIAGRIFRTTGFLVGTYMTAVMIQRLELTERYMWIPYAILTVSGIVSHAAVGWFIDHFGAKPALAGSGLIVAINSVILIHAQSLALFILLFALAPLGGSLLNNGWPTLLLKIAPAEMRPTYTSVLNLAAAPGTLLVTLVGMGLVHATGFDYVFYISAVGSLVGAALFTWKIPHITHSPPSVPH